MAVAELVLVRHGESMGNVAAAVAHEADAEVIEVGQRDADVPLSEVGVRQATALGAGLRDLLADGRQTLVWSSPYVRARQTAGVALTTAGHPLPILVDERLRDRELGVLDLLTTKGVLNRYPLEAERRRWLGKFYHRPPGGESWADVVLRVRSFLLDLEMVADDSRVLVVFHDALVLTIRYVCERLSEDDILGIGASTPVLNVSITQLVRKPADRSWELRRFNDVSHLEGSDAPVTRHGGEGNVHPRS
jgi:broad specificity phosphatase PhoE